MPWSDRHEEIEENFTVTKETCWRLARALASDHVRYGSRGYIGIPFDTVECVVAGQRCQGSLHQEHDPHLAAVLRILVAYNSIAGRSMYLENLEIGQFLDQLVALAATRWNKPLEEVDTWTVEVFCAVRKVHALAKFSS